MKIYFLTSKDSKSQFYPIIKFKRELLNENLDVRIIYSPKLLREADHIVLTSRYFRKMFGSFTNIFRNWDNIIKIIQALADKYDCPISYYDMSDGPGARELILLPHVHSYFKKQVYVDKTFYTGKANNSDCYRIWDVNTRGWITNFANEYDLDKIKIAWNIGYSDYHTNQRLLKSLGYINTVSPTIKSLHKFDFLMSYRGSAKGSQREILKNFILNKRDSVYLSGPPVNRKRFIRELSKTRFTVSPFGHGEICYRDFEAVLNGSVLIKPDMSHLTTWPEFYKTNETYYPIVWDFKDTDLQESIQFLVENSEFANQLRFRSQDKFKQEYLSGVKFTNHIKTMFDVNN